MSLAPFFLYRPVKSGHVGIKLLIGDAVVGRAPTCDIIVDDVSVSRSHAELKITATSVLVRDLKSRNGTYVKGRPIDVSDVRPGDELRFGSVAFLISNSESSVHGNGEIETGTMADPGDSGSLEPTNVRLSEARQRVYEKLLQGHPEKRIASQLNLSRHTVHSHVREIYRSLGVQSRAQLMARALNRTN